MNIGDKVFVYLSGSKLVGEIIDINKTKYVVKFSDGSQVVTSKEYLELYKE